MLTHSLDTPLGIAHSSIPFSRQLIHCAAYIMKYSIHISYYNSPATWDAQTAYWVLHLYSVHGIESYQTSIDTIAFESERDRFLGSIIVTDPVKMV